MTFKDWKKFTEEEAEAKLLEIIESLNGDVFEAFCVEDADTRTGVVDGVVELTPEMENKTFESYIDRNTTKNLINKLVAEHYKEIAHWLANGVFSECIDVVSETPILFEHYGDGTKKYRNDTTVIFARDVSRNPDGYGFILVP